MRWANLIFYLFTIVILIIELVAVFKLYETLSNRIKYNNLTNTFKRNAAVKLRFDKYLRDFNKTYSNKEFKRRFENFKASLKEIARLNKLEGNTVFGLTKFSDMSKEEFAGRMLQKPNPFCSDLNMDCTRTETHDEPLINKNHVGNIPRSFDWRKKGVVKPVLDQKLCYVCWAFSIVGVLESMSAIQLGDYSSRSIQELLDCSSDNNGCYNGSVSIAMTFICMKVKLQFVTEEEYPLKLYIDQKCKLPKTGYSGRRVKRFMHVCKMDEDDMVRKIATHGPLVVAVTSKNWQNYLGGIITRACSGGEGDHVVQIVGYEGYGEPDAETVPYYIVRNSYGEDWGDQGYVKIAMKHGNISNVCGITEEVTLMDVL